MEMANGRAAESEGIFWQLRKNLPEEGAGRVFTEARRTGERGSLALFPVKQRRAPVV